MSDKQIDCVVVKVLSEKVGQKSKTRIRIVRWIVNGKDTGALLEKREFFDGQDGGEKMGKAKGFNLAEVQFIADKKAEIVSAMVNIPKEVDLIKRGQEEAAAAMPLDDVQY